MFNFLGKFLVLIHTFLSLALLGVAVSVFYQFADFGWAVPRKDILEKSIASEYDKSRAVFNEALQTRDLMLAAVEPAQKSLAETEGYLPKNHRFYVQEMARLRTAPDAIEVKSIKPGVLDTPKKPLGKPVLEEPVEGVTKSYQSYLADLRKLKEELDQEQKSIRDITEATKKVTFTLNGKDDAGEQVRPGLYDLIDAEYQAQVANKAEREYLRPIWSQKLNEARDANQRRNSLATTWKQMQSGK